MRRRELLQQVRRALRGRRLVWAGIRGDDVEPLGDLPELSAAFSLLSAFNRRSSVSGLSYETISGSRVDPETWDIDEHLDAPATAEFRQALLASLVGESALIAYRPSLFLSSAMFARHPHCLSFGVSGALQSAFEHKPWVEVAVAQMGIPRIEWRYVADEEQMDATIALEDRPVMLRKSRTSGGEGFVKVEHPQDIPAHWPHIAEAFVSVAPFLEGGLPVNVGATVWNDGVTVHHPSVQLIGIPELVTREFGHCGNDFGAMRDVDPEVIDQVEDSTKRIGRWMGEHGFRGSFGVDYLVHESRALFTEINPRFQGSTHASAQLDIEAGEADLMLEHIAAWLGLPAPSQSTLRQLVSNTPDFAHLVAHWTGSAAARIGTEPMAELARGAAGTVRIELQPDTDIVCEPGSAILRWTARRRFTASGYELLPDVERIDDRLARIEPARGTDG